jgi:hypothetical protein
MLPGQPPFCTELSGNGIVLFTDEFRFHVDFANGCARVWSGRIERFYPGYIIQRDRYCRGSVMIWCGISHNGKTKRVTVNGTPNSQSYCEGIVVPEIVAF